MKNYEITNANFALSQLLDEPLRGKFKFKVFNAKSTLEKANEVIIESLDGVTDEEEREEILQEKQEVNIDKFTEEELEQNNNQTQNNNDYKNDRWKKNENAQTDNGVPEVSDDDLPF